MKPSFRVALLFAWLLWSFSPAAGAQTNYIIVTNYVTVTVTNYVTLTNAFAKAGDGLKTDEAATATNRLAPPPKFPWESSITTGLTLTRGNSDTLLVTAGIQTHKKTPENEFNLGADGAYGENSAVKNVDTLHGFSQYNHLFNERFYGYLRAEALHDGVADLQYRINVGPGVGYYFLKQTNASFAGEFGTTYVNQRLGDVDDNYATLRLADRFEYKFKNYGVRIWENAEILPQVNRFDNFIMNAEVGIESAISKKTSLKTFLVDNYNNDPAAGRDKNDVKLVSAISYKF